MSIADYCIENGIDPSTGQYYSGYDSYDDYYDRMIEEEREESEELRRKEREANPPPTAKEILRKEALDEWARHYGWDYVPLSETQQLEARSIEMYRYVDDEKIPIPADHRQVTYKKDEYRLYFGLVTVGILPRIGQTAAAMMDHFSEETITLYRRKHCRLADVEVMFQNPWHYYGGSYPKDERYPDKQFRKV